MLIYTRAGFPAVKRPSYALFKGISPSSEGELGLCPGTPPPFEKWRNAFPSRKRKTLLCNFFGCVTSLTSWSKSGEFPSLLTPTGGWLLRGVGNPDGSPSTPPLPSDTFLTDCGCTETVQPTFLLLFFFNTILSFVHIHQCILHSVEILKKPGYHKRNKSFKSIKLNLSCVSANALTESVKPAFEKQ